MAFCDASADVPVTIEPRLRLIPRRVPGTPGDLHACQYSRDRPATAPGLHALVTEALARLVRCREIVPVGTGCELTLVHESVLPEQASRTEGRWAGMLYGLDTILAQ